MQYRIGTAARFAPKSPWEPGSPSSLPPWWHSKDAALILIIQRGISAPGRTMEEVTKKQGHIWRKAPKSYHTWWLSSHDNTYLPSKLENELYSWWLYSWLAVLLLWPEGEINIGGQALSATLKKWDLLIVDWMISG